MDKENKESKLLGLILDDDFTESVDEVKIERADTNVKAELELQKEIAEARKAFDEGGFTFGEVVNDEGEVEVALYGKTSKATPIKKLMEMCEADLPFVDEQTKQDYENFLNEFQIKYEEYDISKEKSRVDELF